MENPVNLYSIMTYSPAASGESLDNFWIIQQLLTTLYNSQLINMIQRSYQQAFHMVDNCGIIK